MGYATRLSHESAEQVLVPLAWKTKENMKPVALPAHTLGLTLAFEYPERILAICRNESVTAG